MLSLVGLGITALGFVGASWVGILLGLTSIGLSVFLLIAGWRDESRAAENLFLSHITPVDFPYKEPYDTWAPSRLDNASCGLIYSSDLDRELRNEQVPIKIQIDSNRWIPKPPAIEYWRRWGAKRRKLNELKIRLASDLVAGTTEVTLQKTDYVAYITTNNLAGARIEDRAGQLQPLTFESVGLVQGKLPRLDDSDCSNHIGGDLLLVGRGRVWLQKQNHRNLVEPESYGLSSSGSFDWKNDLKGAEDLVTVVKNGMLRELAEEMGLDPRDVPTHDDVRVIRYGRATFNGGKPQFLAVARFAGQTFAHPTRLRDRFTQQVYAQRFETSESIQGVIEALKEFSHGKTVSRPYQLMVSALESVSKDTEFADWLFEGQVR